jgi:hypothetical protein
MIPISIGINSRRKNIVQVNNSDTLIIGNDKWLVKETRGNTLFDKNYYNTYYCLRQILDQFFEFFKNKCLASNSDYDRI